MTKDELEQIRQLIREEISSMKDDIAQIKEDAKITRVTVNEIGKWVELNSTSSNPYPIDKAI